MSITSVHVCAVAAGGALGAVARYGLTAGMAALWPARFNLATLVANVLGAFLLGIACVVLVQKATPPTVSREFIIMGFLGSFTTFSTFSLEAVGLLQNGFITSALVYAVGSVVLSLAAVAAGMTLAAALVR